MWGAMSTAGQWLRAVADVVLLQLTNGNMAGHPIFDAPVYTCFVPTWSRLFAKQSYQEISTWPCTFLFADSHLHQGCAFFLVGSPGVC